MALANDFRSLPFACIPILIIGQLNWLKNGHLPVRIDRCQNNTWLHNGHDHDFGKTHKTPEERRAFRGSYRLD